MGKLKKVVMSFVMFYVIIILINTAWQEIREGYHVQETDLEDEKNVFEKLSELNLIKGINELGTGLHKLAKIANPLDLLGGLAISASGTLQIIGGVVIFPIQIIGILTGFYGNIFPPIIGRLIGFIVTITVGFILISAKLGYEL